MFGKQIYIAAIITTLGINLAHSSITIPINAIDENGQTNNIGTITAEDSLCGVLLTPQLHNLTPGIHGFHIHVNPSCDDKGMAAGGHFDPAKTNQHNGPYVKHSHLGDLPVLIVNQDGTAALPTLAPRFKVSQMIGHT